MTYVNCFLFVFILCLSYVETQKAMKYDTRLMAMESKLEKIEANMARTRADQEARIRKAVASYVETIDINEVDETEIQRALREAEGLLAK